MPKSNKNVDFKSSAGYQRLLRDVQRVLLEGQRKIEQAKVQIYWETGRLINTDILKHSKRADYGGEMISRLARDLSVSITVLHRCVKFATKYPSLPIVATWPQFTWSHFRQLMTIVDDKQRRRLEKITAEKGWSVTELASRIKGDTAAGKADVPATVIKSVVDNKPLTPLLGTLYTYRLVERPNLSAGSDPELLVDIGFGVYHSPEKKALSGFVKDQIVESRPREGAYKFCKSGRTAKDLFTYLAYVERVIDGDTVKVRLDLGFNVWTRQTLRLRGLDCPEVGTAAGDEARNFVRSHLKEAQQIIVRSSCSDKYDRYLADIFIPRVDLTGAAIASAADPAAYIYLNNLLLETGRAVRMG